MDAVFLRASIMFHVGREREAINLFQQTVDYGEEVRDVRLIARGTYAIGDCHVALGNLGEASIHYHRALPIFRDVGPAVRRIETEWGIARIVLRSERYSDALRLLRAVSAQFENLQMITQAAYVGIDMMEALLALKQHRRIVALAQHLISVFTNAGMLTGALSAFAYLKEAAGAGNLALTDLEQVRSFVRKAQLQPSLRYVHADSPPED